MVQAITTREIRKNFKKYADDVSQLGDTVIVARPNDQNVVLISQEKYNSWQETNYLLKDPANRNALRKSINQLGSNQKTLTPEEFQKLADNDD